MTKQTKRPKTFLTGITGPTPDNKPALKAIDHRVKMFSAKTIPDCIEILHRDIIPYWWKYKSRYPHEYKEIAEIIYYWLNARSARCDKMLPFTPRYNADDSFGGFLSELINWMAIAEICLEHGKENPWDKVPTEAKAQAILIDNPDMTITAIAKKLGVHRQRLYEMPDLMNARRIFKEEQLKTRYYAKTKGSKDGETGELTAYSK